MKPSLVDVVEPQSPSGYGKVPFAMSGPPQFNKHWRQLQKQLQNIILEIILRGPRRLSFTKFKQSPKISQKKEVENIRYRLWYISTQEYLVVCAVLFCITWVPYFMS